MWYPDRVSPWLWPIDVFPSPLEEWNKYNVLPP